MKMNNVKAIIHQKFEKFPEVEIVILFGSVLKDQLTNKSDIDIAFAAKTITSHEKKITYI
ncbi:MAG: nucleotidyltransferase domain-containing protein [Desulfosarcina sp.]|nr:nucleotidyltransferase domain-containing protein [Desulfobacterales bacterium]